MVAQHNEVAEIFADHYSKTARDPQMKSNLKKDIRRKIKNNQPYNERFTERELEAAIKQKKTQHQGKTPYILR